jgi:hypothetical protein
MSIISRGNSKTQHTIIRTLRPMKKGRRCGACTDPPASCAHVRVKATRCLTLLDNLTKSFHFHVHMLVKWVLPFIFWAPAGTMVGKLEAITCSIE